MEGFESTFNHYTLLQRQPPGEKGKKRKIAWRGITFEGAREE
jgi:hypothetical protein